VETYYGMIAHKLNKHDNITTTTDNNMVPVFETEIQDNHYLP